MTGQKPSIGRVVLVPMDPRENNGRDFAPALIVGVNSETSVNVKVFGDSDDPPTLRRSVSLVDTLAAQPAGANVAHTWAWPPRV